MEIENPKLLNNADLRIERQKVIREMARMTLYLGILNDELVARTPNQYEATVTNIDRS